MNLKLFIFSIIMVICLVILMVSLIAISNKKFDLYIEQKELEKLNYLVESLALFYSENDGWGSLKENFDLWDIILEKGWLKNELRNRPDNQEPKENDIITIIYPNNYIPPVWDPLNLGPRICLLDENKKYIIGRNTSPIEECSLLKIELQGKIIGWLSVKEGRKLYQPLDRAFKQNQSNLLYIMGGVYLLILVSITFLFSKQILRPITQLSDATKKLGHLDFNTRIRVKSSDELGDLALHFNSMVQKLEDYERNQKQWLTDISHELRTPLSVLICEIDALNDGIRKPDNGNLTALGNEARHLMKLVNDLNDISLIEAGTYKQKKRLLKPLPILSEDVYVFQKRFEFNNMSIEFEFDETAADIQILGDYDRLKQLFSNILENAICHTKKPGKLIVRQTLNIDHIRFTFEDSGPGVPDDALPFLFDRLYRVDSSRNRKTGGNGLGLAICRSIAEMHNGKIRAQNIQGGGLMVEISLPIESDSYGPADERADIDVKVNPA